MMQAINNRCCCTYQELRALCQGHQCAEPPLSHLLHTKRVKPLWRVPATRSLSITCAATTVPQPNKGKKFVPFGGGMF